MVVAAAVLLPFVRKAYTIDDCVFLRQAEHVLRDPLHPTAFEIVWDTDVRSRLSELHSSGPGMGYLLVPVALADGSEPVAHTVQLMFLLAGIWATVSLGLQLGLGPSEARTGGLILAATPCVLAMASTSMPDIPAMTFGVIGVDRLLAWKISRRPSQAVLGLLSLAAGALTRWHLLLLAGVAGIALANWATAPARTGFGRSLFGSLLPLIAVMATVLTVIYVTRDPAQTSGLLPGIRGRAAWQAAPRNFLAFLSHWVLAVPLALPWVVMRRNAIAWKAFGIFVLSGAGVLIPILSIRWWMLPIVALAAVVLLDVFRDGWGRKDSVQLLLAAWLLLALPALVHPHLPSKYLVASAPAAALLLVRELRWQAPALRRCLVGAILVAGVVLGVLIIHADSKLANLGRRAAAELVAPHIANGRKVWSVGHWGFQWYAERAGASTLSRTPPFPRPGDIVVQSAIDGSKALQIIKKRRLVKVVADASPGGRVMSRSHNAGFFSNDWGNLPWAWGSDDINRFEVWEVQE